MDFGFVRGPATKRDSRNNAPATPAAKLHKNEVGEAVLSTLPPSTAPPAVAQPQNEVAQSGPLLTSNNGYNCYLLVVNEWTRYAWAFTLASKDPPLIRVFSSLHSLATRMACVVYKQTLEANWLVPLPSA